MGDARRAAARGFVALVLLLLGAPLLVACGGGGGGGGTVDVRLTDYDVILSKPSVGAGKVTFAISNAGGFVHEVLLVRSNLSITSLPETSDGRFDEQGAGVTVLASARDVAAGGSARISERLAAGRYYLICNRPAEPGDTMTHFQHGMLAPFEVT